MEIIKTSIDGVLIIEPRVFKDSRGYFFESLSQREFDEKVTPILGHSINFVQDNESMSSYGVMRGLHYQRHIPRANWCAASKAQCSMLPLTSAKVHLHSVSTSPAS